MRKVTKVDFLISQMKICNNITSRVTNKIFGKNNTMTTTTQL